jgi:hypothetical protein
MALQYSDIDDAVVSTRNLLIKQGAFVDLQSDLTDHTAVRELWKNKRKAFEGGYNWTFTAQMDHNHSFKAVGMYETDSSVMVDTLVEGSVSPRHVNAHYEYDQKHPAFQGGATKIVDFVQAKQAEMTVSFWEGLEAACWTDPGATDTKAIHGIPHWIVKGTAGQEGFYGVNPTGYTSGCAGISSTTYPRWANYFADYTVIDEADLLRKLIKGHYAVQFRSPLNHAEPDLGKMGNGIYVNLSTIVLLEEYLKSQNMNNGTDLAFYQGRATFKGTPIVYAPYLDNDSSDPIYLIDWKWLAMGVLSGWAENQTAPYMVPGKHTVRRVDLDATMEVVCTNRRRQAVFAKV